MAITLLAATAIGDLDDWVGPRGRESAGETKVSCLNPGEDPLGLVGDPTFKKNCYIRTLTLNDEQSFNVDAPPAGTLGIVSVKMGLVVQNLASISANLDLFFRMDGTNGTATTENVAADSGRVNISPVTVARPGGGAWTSGDLNNPDFQMAVKLATSLAGSIGGLAITSMWIELDASSVPLQVENPRSVASMLLRDGRDSRRLTIPVSMEFIGQELMDDFNISHFVIPHAAGPAERVKNWERHFMRLVGETFDPQNMQLIHTYESKRHYLVLDWDIGLSTQSPTTTADGVARLSVGGRTFTRASNAWIESPGSGQVVLVGENSEKNDKNGLLIEGSSTGQFKNSAFTDGIASDWTTEGTGSGGSAVADDTTTALLFDTSITAQSVKITAGDPLGGTPVGFLQTTASFAADTVISVALDHFDDSRQPLSVRLQRSVDSFYWNEAERAWQAAEIWNDFPVRLSITQDIIKNVDVGGSATTITGKVSSRTTAGQINHVQYFQLEDSEFPTSRIVTRDTTFTRSADLLTISNNTGARTWFPTRGSWKAEVVTQWDTLDLPSGAIKTLIYVKYDASNEDKVFYRESDQNLVFLRTLAGTDYESVVNVVFTRGVPTKVGCRWTSDQGEEDLTNYSITTFANSLRGIDAVPGGEPTAPANVNMIRGSEADDVNAFDGHIRFHEVTQQVLTDSEMVR